MAVLNPSSSLLDGEVGEEAVVLDPLVLVGLVDLAQPHRLHPSAHALLGFQYDKVCGPILSQEPGGVESSNAGPHNDVVVGLFCDLFAQCF